MIQTLIEAMEYISCRHAQSTQQYCFDIPLGRKVTVYLETEDKCPNLLAVSPRGALTHCDSGS